LPRERVPDPRLLAGDGEHAPAVGAVLGVDYGVVVEPQLHEPGALRPEKGEAEPVDVPFLRVFLAAQRVGQPHEGAGEVPVLLLPDAVTDREADELLLAGAGAALSVGPRVVGLPASRAGLVQRRLEPGAVPSPRREERADG